MFFYWNGFGKVYLNVKGVFYEIEVMIVGMEFCRGFFVWVVDVIEEGCVLVVELFEDKGYLYEEYGLGW